MTDEKRDGLMKDIVYGLIGGLVGTFVMDKVTTAVYKLESDQTKNRESMLMKESAYTVLARRVAEKVGCHPTDQQASKLGAIFHWAYGITWAGLYGVLRQRVPAFSKAAGLPYALAVWAFGDEWLTTALKISPPPKEFPLAVHLRGLVGHISYVAATDGAYRFLKKQTTIRHAYA